MKQIEHNPNEDKKILDLGYKEHYRKELGREPTPLDALNVLAPLVILVLGLYAWRNDWF